MDPPCFVGGRQWGLGSCIFKQLSSGDRKSGDGLQQCRVYYAMSLGTSPCMKEVPIRHLLRRVSCTPQTKSSGIHAGAWPPAAGAGSRALGSRLGTLGSSSQQHGSFACYVVPFGEFPFFSQNLPTPCELVLWLASPVAEAIRPSQCRHQRAVARQVLQHRYTFGVFVCSPVSWAVDHSHSLPLPAAITPVPSEPHGRGQLGLS